MDLMGYNIWATLVAWAISLFIGMIWFAPPIFGKFLQPYTRIRKPRSVAVAIWALCYLMVSFAMGYLLKHIEAAGVLAGIRWGFTVGLVVAVTGLAPNFAFERKPLSEYLIEAGQVVVAITVIGAILGGWR